MTKKPSSKRASLPRQVGYTREFKKSWERYKRAGQRDMNLAVTVMQIIYAGEPIPPEYLDHSLLGVEWAGTRELHISGDFLLVYRLSDKGDSVIFVDIGTHSELFG